MAESGEGGLTMADEQERRYFECVCGHPTHVLRFTHWLDGEDPWLYVDTFLAQDNFWGRLKRAAWYLFKKEGRFFGGCGEETCLDKDTVDELIAFLQGLHLS